MVQMQTITHADAYEIAERTKAEALAAIDAKRHYFIAFCGFQVDPDSGNVKIGPDNLAIPIEVVCFICETTWSEGMTDTPCPGEPTEGEPT